MGLRIGTFLLVVVFCTPSHAVEVLAGPTLTMNPAGAAPLAGEIALQVDEPVQVQLTITYQGDSRVVSFQQTAMDHVMPLLGLKPDRTYTVDVEMLPGGLAGTVLATTPPLPDDFPTLVLNASVPEAMEPGYTLLDCFGRLRDDPRPKYKMIVDSLGEVVWYSTNCGSATLQLPSGTLMNRIDNLVQFADMLGRVRLLPLEAVGTGLHHDLQLTPHGTFLSLTASTVEVENFPTSETDPNAPTATTLVRDEPVLEFFPDGTLRREWSLVELLDETRIAYDSLLPKPEGVDWAHTNAVTYRPEDDSIIVSVRHQDAVIKFSRATGELQWILGVHENWSGPFQPYLLDPVGSPFRWQFHQHAPMWTDHGTLLLFDNGNHRASPFDGTDSQPVTERFSRAVEYEIDTDLMQVREVWEFGESTTPRLYSSFISDADWQPMTGNRLITFGGTGWIDGVPGEDLGLGPVHTRVIETTDETPATPVFDLTVFDPTGGRIATYRSERIPSLYPPEQIAAPYGIGNSLRLDRADGDSVLEWSAAPVDAGHTAADYYIVYRSDSASSGFTILESLAALSHVVVDGEPALEFYRIVAANSAGTSGDEPALSAAVD